MDPTLPNWIYDLCLFGFRYVTVYTLQRICAVSNSFFQILNRNEEGSPFHSRVGRMEPVVHCDVHFVVHSRCCQPTNCSHCHNVPHSVPPVRAASVVVQHPYLHRNVHTVVLVFEAVGVCGCYARDCRSDERIRSDFRCLFYGDIRVLFHHVRNDQAVGRTWILLTSRVRILSIVFRHPYGGCFCVAVSAIF